LISLNKFDRLFAMLDFPVFNSNLLRRGCGLEIRLDPASLSLPFPYIAVVSFGKKRQKKREALRGTVASMGPGAEKIGERPASEFM
jgi:hypothetical protein